MSENRPSNWRVDADVQRASTPPPAFYSDPEVYRLTREAVFARSWQWVPDAERVFDPAVTAAPFTLLPGLLDEPLIATREGDALRALSNACTHRGMLVAERCSAAKGLRCGYHGRRFGLDGKFLSAPGFEDALDFPKPEDDLAQIPFERFGPLAFTNLAGESPFAPFFEPVRRRVGHLPIDRAVHEPARDRIFTIDAHWALYVENYLEGLHIPYIHPGLAQTLEFANYGYELFPGGTLQLGRAAAGEPAFLLPPGHPDAADSAPGSAPVAAWYFWLFPNLMVNVYPFGVSMNVVQPLGPARTRILFKSYVFDADQLGAGAGGDLDTVEREDELAVEAVQRGLTARLYRRGRYAPSHEQGTHHFHRLWGAALDAGAGSSR